MILTGVWSIGYLLRINICRRRRRQQDWVEGKVKLRCWSNQALTNTIGDLKYIGSIIVIRQWTKMVPQDSMELGKHSLQLRPTLKWADSWKLFATSILNTWDKSFLRGVLGGALWCPPHIFSAYQILL